MTEADPPQRRQRSGRNVSLTTTVIFLRTIIVFLMAAALAFTSTNYALEKLKAGDDTGNQMETPSQMWDSVVRTNLHIATHGVMQQQAGPRPSVSSASRKASQPILLSDDTELQQRLQAAEIALTQRVCGSPAKGAYAHVDTACLLNSPTALWWRQWMEASKAGLEMAVHLEPEADYDGVAVAWGVGNKLPSARECGEACRQHKPGTVAGTYSMLPCNAFAWCGSEKCFEPDIHTHTRGDCWLKFTEAPLAPEVNMRGTLDTAYRQRHPSAPAHVQWTAGVVLPAGLNPRNGTWGPRYLW